MKIIAAKFHFYLKKASKAQVEKRRTTMGYKLDGNNALQVVAGRAPFLPLHATVKRRVGVGCIASQVRGSCGKELNKLSLLDLPARIRKADNRRVLYHSLIEQIGMSYLSGSINPQATTVLLLFVRLSFVETIFREIAANANCPLALAVSGSAQREDHAASDIDGAVIPLNANDDKSATAVQKEVSQLCGNIGIKFETPTSPELFNMGSLSWLSNLPDACKSFNWGLFLFTMDLGVLSVAGTRGVRGKFISLLRVTHREQFRYNKQIADTYKAPNSEGLDNGEFSIKKNILRCLCPAFYALRGKDSLEMASSWDLLVYAYLKNLINQEEYEKAENALSFFMGLRHDLAFLTDGEGPLTPDLLNKRGLSAILSHRSLEKNQMLRQIKEAISDLAVCGNKIVGGCT